MNRTITSENVLELTTDSDEKIVLFATGYLTGGTGKNCTVVMNRNHLDWYLVCAIEEVTIITNYFDLRISPDKFIEWLIRELEAVIYYWRLNNEQTN